MYQFDPTYISPEFEWRKANPIEKVGAETYRLLDLWQMAALANNEASGIIEDWQAWWNSRSQPLPDLVQLIAYYGESRLLTQGWKEVPIKVDPKDADRWNDPRCGLGASLVDFRNEFQASVAGGFFQEATKDPEWLGKTLASQVTARLARLKEVTELPREHYTPAYLDMEFESDLEKNFWLTEEEGDDELDRLAEPAALYETLHCFSWGLQKFRLFSTSLNEPEFGLPSEEVFNALMQVDVNDLLDQLAYAEPKLKDILAWVWSKDPNFVPDIDYMPATFWWRHVREHMETKGQTKKGKRS